MELHSEVMLSALGQIVWSGADYTSDWFFDKTELNSNTYDSGSSNASKEGGEKK